MNAIVKSITSDGRTGFDQYNQLIAWTKPDGDGMTQGRMIKDVRTCTCYICGKGWGNTTEELVDQNMVNDHDVHNTCLYGYRKINAHFDIQQALMNAGYLFNMEEVPPRYPNSTPWQRIKILHADKERSDTGFRITLGRRKRVWEVRGHNFSTNLEPVFKHINETKGYGGPSAEEPEFSTYHYVHAHTKATLVEVLKLFRAEFQKLTGTSIDRKDA